MKLFTAQHKSVITPIEFVFGGEGYTAKKGTLTDPSHYRLYRRLMNDNPNAFKEYYNDPEFVPIWAWAKVQKQEVTRANAVRLLSTTIHWPHENISEYVLLELDIPDDKVVLTNYYKWSDYLFYSVGELPDANEAENCWNQIYSLDDSEHIQAIFPEIRKNNITGIYDFTMKKWRYIKDEKK